VQVVQWRAEKKAQERKARLAAKRARAAARAAGERAHALKAQRYSVAAWEEDLKKRRGAARRRRQAAGLVGGAAGAITRRPRWHQPLSEGEESDEDEDEDFNFNFNQQFSAGGGHAAGQRRQTQVAMTHPSRAAQLADRPGTGRGSICFASHGAFAPPEHLQAQQKQAAKAAKKEVIKTVRKAARAAEKAGGAKRGQGQGQAGAKRGSVVDSHWFVS
jgi:hypothetical protein